MKAMITRYHITENEFGETESKSKATGKSEKVEINVLTKRKAEKL